MNPDISINFVGKRIEREVVLSPPQRN